MKKNTSISTSIFIIFWIGACNLQSAGTPIGTISDSVATKVVLTLAAFTQSAQGIPLASPTLEQPTIFQTVAVTPTSTPTVSLTPTMMQTLTPTDTPVPKPGVIAGDISGYPYGSLPKLVIVAFDQEPPYNYSYWITAAGDTSYSMTSNYLIHGKYQVVAYDSKNHTGGCLVFVRVISDQTVRCDISSWGGGYPAKPSGVPNP